MANEQEKKSGGFNSRLGVILAAAGSSVGLHYMFSVFVPVSQKPWKRFLRPAFIFSLKWIVPTAILLIVLNGLGIFDKLLH